MPLLKPGWTSNGGYSPYSLTVAKAPWMLGPHDSVGPTKSRNLGSRNMLPCQGMGSGGAEETGPWNQEVLRTAHSRLKQEGPEAGSSWQAPEGLAGHVWGACFFSTRVQTLLAWSPGVVWLRGTHWAVRFSPNLLGQRPSCSRSPKLCE